MEKTCVKCQNTFEALRSQKRCDPCRLNGVCDFCRSSFKKKGKVRFCSRSCSGKWSSKIRINPKRSLKARVNMSAAQKKAYSEGRKKPWNMLPNEERITRKKIHRMWGSLLHRLLKRGTKKEGHSHEQLGYSKRDLRRHLESLWQEGMSWENYGLGEGKWNIDHIRPIASFPIETHASVVNALSNIRPMWATDNLKKGSH